MKSNSNIRLYAWAEFVIWLIIVAVAVFGIRYHHYNSQKQFKNYQIFLEDVDGLIVGSPVRFLGVQIGYVKKIQVISSHMYIKFVVTQKDLSLPTGVIATIEGSGLGGSKALEIYPPNKLSKTDKIIVTKEPTRLSKVMGLFDSIFKELDSIISTITHASLQFETTSTGNIPSNVVTPVDVNKQLDSINSSIDSFIEKKENFMNNIRGKNDE